MNACFHFFIPGLSSHMHSDVSGGFRNSVRVSRRCRVHVKRNKPYCEQLVICITYAPSAAAHLLWERYSSKYRVHLFLSIDVLEDTTVGSNYCSRLYLFRKDLAILRGPFCYFLNNSGSILWSERKLSFFFLSVLFFRMKQ